MPNIAPILEALALPPATLVDRRVPKTLLVENGAPTAGDKRLMRDGIEGMRWLASLKPESTGIAAWKSVEGDYSEIAVLTVEFREKAKVPRLTGLIHRAIPYPLLLIGSQGEWCFLSLAHKRLSQAEKGKTVLEDRIHSTQPFPSTVAGERHAAFLSSLAIHHQNAADLHRLYDSWIARLTALELAEQGGGSYRPDLGIAESYVLRDELDKGATIRREIATLRKSATGERQHSRRAELNLRIRILEADLKNIIGNF